MRAVTPLYLLKSISGCARAQCGPLKLRLKCFGSRDLFWRRLYSAHAMIRPYVNGSNETNLFSTPVVIRTRRGEEVKLDAVFQDTMPQGSAIGTVVNAHGAPGSHKDFKYVNPKLENAGVRVIGVNFPGCGYTDFDERLLNDNPERVQFVQQIVDALKLNEKVVFIGHSRGSENCVKMAAENEDKTVGIVSINPIGIRPHRGAHPLFLFTFLAFLWRITWLRWFSNWLVYQIYAKFAKFKVPNGSVCGVAITQLADLNYADAKPYIDKFNQAKAQAVLLYAGNDWLIEPELSREFVDLFHDSIEVSSPVRGEDDEATQTVLQELGNGRKSVGVFCAKDGHFLQKDRCGLIADAILNMLQRASA